MNEQIIEAAAQAFWESIRDAIDDDDVDHTFDEIPPHLRDRLRVSVRKAIQAHDAARAPEIREAVDRLMGAAHEVMYAQAYEPSREEECARKEADAIRDLLALFSIESSGDGENVT